jgi:hypothetical protein
MGIPLYLFDFAAFVRRQVIPLGCKMLLQDCGNAPIGPRQSAFFDDGSKSALILSSQEIRF